MNQISEINVQVEFTPNLSPGALRPHIRASILNNQFTSKLVAVNVQSSNGIKLYYGGRHI